jgi:predicted GNAT superfamily acetyltransferase
MGGMTPPVIRELTELADFQAAARLLDDIWRPGPEGSTAPIELQRALSKAGNYVAGAYEGERLVGAAMAFFGPPAERTLHSHIAGVGATARGLGLALKLHQRAWALDRGAHTIAWTFDPLVSRNAWFNLSKLGARPVEYLADFYGPMGDGLNAGDDSDRLLLHWDLTRPVGGAPVTRDDAVIGLDRVDGRPVPGSTAGHTVLIAVPPDIEKLRPADPAAARQWRHAVRDTLQPLLAGGARITGFDRTGWYVVTR